MTRPQRLGDTEITTWLAANPAWTRVGEALVRAYALDNFSRALAFVTEVGLLAEKHDHHPDVELGWGKAKLLWTTHDAGGITPLDRTLAEASDATFSVYQKRS
jgi:4a-hydroxytetrahydrobiopterin dehydratase